MSRSTFRDIFLYEIKNKNDLFLRNIEKKNFNCGFSVSKYSNTTPISYRTLFMESSIPELNTGDTNGNTDL